MTQFVLALCIAAMLSLAYWVGYADVDAIITNVNVESESFRQDIADMSVSVRIERE